MGLVDYFVVFVFGSLVGGGELISRYRDEPWRALQTVPAALYLIINALAACGALRLIAVFGWSFGLDPGQSPEALRWTRVLVAGFGAMALFRTSLFVVRAGNEDIGIGPSGFLQVILRAADRGVDRLRARARAPFIGRAMEKVDFDLAYEVLPAYCLALMQNLSPDEQRELGDQIRQLRESAASSQLKAQLLGLALMNAVGEDVLLAAVEALGKQIQVRAPAPSPAP